MVATAAPAAAPAIDVEMEVVEDPETLKKDADNLAVQEIREHTKQIDKAVASKEPRFILRVLRSLPNTRRKLNANVLRSLAAQLYPAGAERESILVYVEELPAGSAEPEVVRPRVAVKTPLPEVDAYFHLLSLVRLLDANLLEKASQCGKRS
jgi:26S proteasome regulatory subunit N3